MAPSATPEHDPLREEILLLASEASPLWEIGWTANALLDALHPAARRAAAIAMLKRLVADGLVCLAEHHPGDLLPGDRIEVGPPGSGMTLPGPVYDYGEDVPLPIEAVDELLDEPRHWEVPSGGHGGVHVVLLLTEEGERRWDALADPRSDC